MKLLKKLPSQKVKKLIGFAFIAGCIALTASYWAIETLSHKYTFQEVEQLPDKKVGLLLGTSKRLRSGAPNPYFYHRIDAAVQLYKAGKVKYILVSGDNGSKYYNEPRDMQQALLARGVPQEAIYLDFAGFRTLDSVIRCKEIFGQSDITIISQGFHNKRAIFISRALGINAVGYNAKDVKQNTKVAMREILARVKALLDLYILGTQPRFLGEAIQIG